MPAPRATSERDYVLGTHDEEIARLGLQHRVWRPRALDAWQRAGFTVGQTLLDVGCGPGWATMDLAEIAGPGGRVHAVDRSRRFLDTLESRGLANVQTHERDLDEAGPPAVEVDGAWSRWVLCFVKRPRDLVAKVRETLRPGGTWVLHEYLDYSTWRLAPRSPDFEDFVRIVMENWRASGGEPDVGMDLPRWLEEAGFEIRSLKPIVDVVSPANFMWQWPKAFLEVGLRHMVSAGKVPEERAQRIWKSFAEAEAAPHTLTITPTLLEIVAARR